MIRDILGYKCRKCGSISYPNHYRCPKCHHTEWRKMDVEFDKLPLPKNGTLLTYTHLYALPPDYEQVFLTLGIVELENGNRLTGQLKIEKPKIGMKVKGKVEVVRKTDYDKYYGIVFYES